MKMQAIIDSTTPTNQSLAEDEEEEEYDASKDSSRDLVSPDADYLRNAQLHDDSDVEDDSPVSSRLKPPQNIERSHSPQSRNVAKTSRNHKNGESLGGSDKQAQKPAMSLSPTLRRSKLAALAESQGGASTHGAPPRGSISRMSIRSKHLKEIPKDDPRISDVSTGQSRAHSFYIHVNRIKVLISNYFHCNILII